MTNGTDGINLWAGVSFVAPWIFLIIRVDGDGVARVRAGGRVDAVAHDICSPVGTNWLAADKQGFAEEFHFGWGFGRFPRVDLPGKRGAVDRLEVGDALVVDGGCAGAVESRCR